VLQLTAGAAATQVLAFALAPIIARLYSPEAFGAAATFASALAILVTIVTLRYELAILLPESARKAAAVAWGALLIVVVLSALLFLPLVLLRARTWDSVPWSLLAYPKFLPWAVLLSGVTVVLVYWGIRHEKFGLLSTNRVVSASVAEAGRLALGLLGRDAASSLIVANMVGVLAGIIVLARGMRNQLGLFLRVRLPEAASTLRQYYKFPLFASWAGVLNTLSHQITPLVLGGFFAAQVVGYYAQANRVTITPLILLSTAITQVFARSAARARLQGGLDALTTATARNMLRLAWYPALALLCLGPELTSWFLGGPWAEAGRYAQILSLWMLTTLISDPLSALYAVLERQELGLALNLVLLVLRVGGLAIGGLRGDPVLALALFAGSGAAVNLAQTVLLVRLARGRLIPMLSTGVVCLVFTAPLLLLTAARPFLGGAPGVAVYITLAGGLCYVGLWVASDRQIRRMAAALWRDLWHRRPKA
jgi:O-antigen/teichoic acid export membrane protein